MKGVSCGFDTLSCRCILEKEGKKVMHAQSVAKIYGHKQEGERKKTH
jgi:hypothetical protein